MNGTSLPITPFVFLALLLLPVRIAGHRLRFLAFTLWLLGGMVMVVRGALRFRDAAAGSSRELLWGMIAAALLIGWAKGRFVLAKTSSRNRARLAASTARLRPIQVYPVRSWVLIAVFMLLGLSLAWFGAPLLWRGAVGVAVGVGLVTSSFDYLRA